MSVFTGISRCGVVVALDAVEELVVDGGEAGVVTLAGVVALAQDDGRELGSGGEVDAGFAHGFELAVELDGTGAVAAVGSDLADGVRPQLFAPGTRR